MSRIRLKNGGKPRHKAFFGADGAIMAAATLAAAGITAGATAAAAKSQAKAVTESAKTQAQSIKDQSANNTNLQKESISFTRQQNQENRQQQQDIQTTLQMLAGQENMNDRMEANKMQVRYGGRPKRRSLKSEPSYGGGNQPFRVTDGGGAVPLQVDPFGYGLYELVGNDHEHYHKAPGGKNKTGVGIKFPDGSVVEGEGNQNTNQGELLYVTPNDAMFISKHSIDGFNPAKAVNTGVHPVQAFQIQETIKNKKGYKDDGTKAENGKGITYYDKDKGHYVINRERVSNAIHSVADPIFAPLRSLKRGFKGGSFGGGRTGGGGASAYMPYPTTEYVEVPDTTYVPVPVVRTFNDAFKTARQQGDSIFEFNGKKYTTEMGNNPNSTAVGNNRIETSIVPIRKISKRKVPVKKEYGGQQILSDNANITSFASNGTAPVASGVVYAVNQPDVMPSPVTGNTFRRTLKCGGRHKAAWGDYAGATYNAAGNLFNAGITTWGNMYAGKKLGQAYMQAGDILADAYSQMHGIDMRELSRKDYEAPHTLAVVRSANTNINPQLERIRRNSSAERREINRGTMSSAARQQRLAGTNDRMFQRIGEQYAYKENQDEQIKQGNAERITQTAQANADRDVAARRDWGNQRLSLLQYNNNIENAKIAGMAQARADALTQSQSAQSSAFQNSMGTIGSALSASGQGFASAFDASRKYKAEAAYNLIGMNDVQQIDWVVSTNDIDGARRILSLKTSQLGRPGLTDADKSKIQTDIDYLKSKFPNLK